jgi:hypothetical protein
MSDADLVAAAITAMSHAYAPYSTFCVGAAIRDENGQIHSGANVENAAYPQGACAEVGGYFCDDYGRADEKLMPSLLLAMVIFFVRRVADAGNAFVNLPKPQHL